MRQEVVVVVCKSQLSAKILQPTFFHVILTRSRIVLLMMGKGEGKESTNIIFSQIPCRDFSRAERILLSCELIWWINQEDTSFDPHAVLAPGLRTLHQLWEEYIMALGITSRLGSLQVLNVESRRPSTSIATGRFFGGLLTCMLEEEELPMMLLT